MKTYVKSFVVSGEELGSGYFTTSSESQELFLHFVPDNSTDDSEMVFSSSQYIIEYVVAENSPEQTIKNIRDFLLWVGLPISIGMASIGLILVLHIERKETVE